MIIFRADLCISFHWATVHCYINGYNKAHQAFQPVFAIRFTDFISIEWSLCCRYNSRCCTGLHLRSSWLMPLIPAHYYKMIRCSFLSRKQKYQNTRGFLHRGKPTKRYETKAAPQWSFGLFSCCHPCSPLNTDGDSSVARSLLTHFPFLFPSPYAPPPPSQEPVCQQKPCTSPCAYQTVYPFPVGAILHLWLWQPMATQRVHSKLWFRHLVLPALFHQAPPSHLSWIFHTQGPTFYQYKNT